MLVVQFLTRPPDECHPFGTLIDDYLTLINECWVVKVRNILRKGKMCAYHLVKLVQRSNVGSTWLITSPKSLLPFLQVDSYGNIYNGQGRAGQILTVTVSYLLFPLSSHIHYLEEKKTSLQTEQIGLKFGFYHP
ncbi:hypothetical protein Golax_015916 [Gossypium laxum]|uniref:Uncharacterized protein n=1 Tax=Gossypium laxum TaxID=34288 RepID=A0A7J8YWW2_9ROSI|nr:hypothetical protein [Gossypium laxum]